jgi:hypothetical protein
MLSILMLAQIMPTTSFGDALVQIAAFLAGPSFAVIISQWLETWKPFQVLSPDAKKLVSFLLVTAGQVVAYLLASSGALNALPQNNPTLAAVLVLISYMVSQVYHAWATRKT